MCHPPPQRTNISVNTNPLVTDPAVVLDPDDGSEQPWAKALAAGDSDRARSAFIDAIRQGPTRTTLDTDLIALRRRWTGFDPGEHAGFDLDPDAIVDGRYVGAYGIEHHFTEGIEWHHNPTEGPEHDFTPEWQWTLNRHYHWVTLADAYEETGDTTYANAFERDLLGWINDCPRPADRGLTHPSAWRTIEAGIRAGQVWPYAFETFRRSAAVSDDALWRWVCSFRDHGRHLLEYVMSHNWKTIESNGLTHVGGMFPELDGAHTYLWTGIDRSLAELDRQFYPDGLQHELAPGYGVLASLANIYSALSLGQSRGELLVSDRAWDRLAAIGEVYGRLAAPDGRCPPLHDSDYLDVGPVIAELDRDVRPWELGHSERVTWGGYGILRRDGRYAMLDAGPYGAGHQHQDTLQVLAFAEGDWLLVDPGSPQYTDSPVTDHLRSAAAHNLVLLDGECHGVRPEVLIADDPHPLSLATTAAIDATGAARSFETVDGGVTFDHERILCDLAGVGWLVLDRLVPRDGRAHAFEWLWQTPHKALTASDGDRARVVVTPGADTPVLRIEVTGTRASSLSVGSTERDPYRGWKPTGEAADHDPLPTVRVESARSTGEMEMLTLLSPTGAMMPHAAFDETERRAILSVGAEDHTITLVDGDAGWAETIRYNGPDHSDTMSLSPHAFLAE